MNTINSVVDSEVSLLPSYAWSDIWILVRMDWVFLVLVVRLGCDFVLTDDIHSCFQFAT